MKNKTTFSVPMTVIEKNFLTGTWQRFHNIRLCTLTVVNFFEKLDVSYGAKVLLEVSKFKHGGSQSFDLVLRKNRIPR